MVKSSVKKINSNQLVKKINSSSVKINSKSWLRK